MANSLPYKHTNFAQAVAQLSARLNNAGYWTQAEMQFALVSALRMWQALACSYKTRGEFSVDNPTVLIDLHAVLPDLAPSVTDQSLVSEIQYHLLEPATGNSWTGSDQFTLAEVVNALQRRRNQFLVETAALQTYTKTIPGPPPSVNRLLLTDKTIDVRRLEWIDTATGERTVLYRDDDFSSLSFNPGWPQDPDLPQVYSVAITSPTTVELIPSPLNEGTLESVTINAGPDLDPTGETATILGIPDDYTWAVKFGALADLLQVDGPTRDPQRAKFCEMLYAAGVEAAKINPVILLARANNELLYVESIFNLDTFIPSWENCPSDSTQVSGASGRNIFALAPVVATSVGATLDYVPNMPVPVSTADYVQVGRETLEVILDLAFIFCVFKQGGQEFIDSTALYPNFIRLAGVANSRISASAFYKTALDMPSHSQDKDVPRTRGENTNA